MFGNYLKVALRNIARHKVNSLINISGLAVGMACCVLIFLWVQHELSFDRFHEHGDELYMVGSHVRYGDRVSTGTGTPPALAHALVEEYPEIIRATRFSRAGVLVLRHGEKVFDEYVFAVDPDFLMMFTFPLVDGDALTALTDPHSIVLTEKMAQKYFGDEDPLGKTITVNGEYSYAVTGVLRNMPQNSIIHFDLLIPFESLEELWKAPGYLDEWSNYNTSTYVQLQKAATHEIVSLKIAGRIKEAVKTTHDRLFLRPYTKLYLYGLTQFRGRIGLVILFSLIALFVLAIACINFMNLTTARSAARAGEIGMRKVSGAHRRDIVIQFYGESFLMSFISLGVAVVLVELLLPVFNSLVERQLTLSFANNPVMALGLIGVALVTAIVAGFYPALFMSLFQPATIIKGGLGPDSRSSDFRKTLVVVQFTLSVILIVATVVISKQVDYMRSMDLGFDKEHLVYFELKSWSVKNKCEALKQELLRDPNILHVSLTSRTPMGVYTNGSGWKWQGRNSGTDPLVTYYFTDVDFPETFGIDMVQGTFFPKERAGGSSSSSKEVVINEQLAQIMGLEDPLGARLSNYGRNYTVIGVIKDFHFKPLYQRIEPMIVFHKIHKDQDIPHRYNYLFAKIGSGNVTQTMTRLRDVYEKFNPGFPFTPRFFDERYDRLYSGQQRMGSIIRYFAGLTILISCLGLFGLAAYTTERRTQEIGVRKVLGASVFAIVRLLSREFLVLVAVANLIAWAVAYLLMHGWLQNFAYRTPLGWGSFALAGFLSLAIAILSVSFQAIRAATANPVEALKYE